MEGKKYVSLQAVMNRLEYWIKAQSQYSVHSPFVFEMYRKVLFARVKDSDLDDFVAQLPPEWVASLSKDGRLSRQYLAMTYKLHDHYQMCLVCIDSDEAVLEGGDQGLELVKVLFRPHRHRARELRWMAQQNNAKYNVSIDLFDVGILMFHPKLHKQHFLLR